MNNPSSAGSGGEKRSYPRWGSPGRPPADFEALVDRLGKWAGRATGGLLGDPGWTPAAEEDETADSYRVRVELPGISRDQISIDLEGHQVRVYGDLAGGGAEAGYLAHRSGRFEYRTDLPADARPDAVRADLAAGILTVTVPREGRGERRTVRIGDAEDRTDSGTASPGATGATPQ